MFDVRGSDSGPVSAAIYVNQTDVRACAEDVKVWLSATNRTNIAIHFVIAQGVSLNKFDFA